MKEGETVTILRQAYTINYIKPCTMEKGKKMARILLRKVPKGFLEKLDHSIFDEFNFFPEMGLAKIRISRKHIMIFQTGEISIRAAENEKDVLETADLFASLLNLNQKNQQ